jgi:hypothetical protein
MKYICVQPRLVYYAWQLEVMISNFLKHGVSPQDIQILVAYSPDQNDRTNHPDVVDLFSKLLKRFEPVKFFFYRDTRTKPCYISSVRPNILKQHFKWNPDLTNEAVFYHDCDIVFTKTPDFSKFINSKVWYMSNTEGYIGSRYILSKGEDIYNKMCEIVGIDKKIPKIMESNSGGAQYLMKGLTSEFWEKVESDSEKLYQYFLDDEPKKLAENPAYHPIQKWTSDMWAVLWNAWYFEHETKVDEYFNFTWATDSIDKWNQNLIYHNAGVVGPGELFYKGQFINTLPYFCEDTFSQNNASYNYFKEIKETSNKSCLIVKENPTFKVSGPSI